jgi:hypothetical protein
VFGGGGEVRINRSTHQVKPFYLSSETVPPIKRNRSTHQVKPFYLSNRSTFQTQLVPLLQGGGAKGSRGAGPNWRDSRLGDREPGPLPAGVSPAVAAKVGLRNRSTYQVKPLHLSSQTVPPIKPNRSTYRVKPFYLSSQTVLPFKRNLVPLLRGQGACGRGQAALQAVHGLRRTLRKAAAVLRSGAQGGV